MQSQFRGRQRKCVTDKSNGARGWEDASERLRAPAALVGPRVTAQHAH